MKIDDVQICRYLRLYGRAPGAALEERIRAMREAADAVMRPVRVWRRFEDVAIAGGAGSQSLASHLALCHAVYLVCATIGVGFDALQRRTAVEVDGIPVVLHAADDDLLLIHADLGEIPPESRDRVFAAAMEANTVVALLLGIEV